MPATGAVCMIWEMALPTASLPGLISGAGSGCVRVQHSGTGAESEKEEGTWEGREVGLSPVTVSSVVGRGCHASVSGR